MACLRGQFIVLFFAFLPHKVKVLDNGLARTPPMGWMSWGYYMCGVKCDENPDKCLDEKLILSVADKFYSEGYQEAGYEYIIIDDCWSEKHRDENGRLVPDRKRFPQGMKYIADYIHARGLKFGMYTNIAEITCMGCPGSKDHFKEDAQMFAEWDVDYLKVDGCYVKEDYLNIAYITLGEHLNETGRSMVYSCSWPYYIQYIIHKEPDLGQVAKYCNMWRNYHDVALSWPAVKAIINHYDKEYHFMVPYHAPGQWNDPDMLIFGTEVLTESQSRIQLAVYAMMSAPLLLSCDMNKITPYEKQLLQNLDLIAIAQDPLGIMAEPYHELSKYVTMYVKRHLPMKGDAYHSFSFALVNFDTAATFVSFSPAKYGLDCTDGYSVMNVFTGVFLNNITLTEDIVEELPAEDVVLYTLFPL